MNLGTLTVRRLTIESKLRTKPDYVRTYIKHLFAQVLLLSSIHNERRALSKLTKDELLDIGICRGDALRESEISCWDVPEERQLDFYESTRKLAETDTKAARR